jgi:hypothetical protein
MPSFFDWVTSPSPRKPAELELPAPASAPSEVPAGELSAEPFVDRGMEIPGSYGVDIVRALVQDPFHLMVYWELRAESLRALELLFPNGDAADFRPTMRLTELADGSEAYVHVPLTGKYWFGASPNRQYRVDAGALSPIHGFVPIVRSNVVETPRGTVAATVDDDPRYRVETPRFVRLLEVTGFATDRVLTDVARAEAARAAGEPARLSTPVAPPSFLVDAFSKLPEPVRLAAVAVAEGSRLTGGMIDDLPEELRAILASFRGADEEEILTAAFMHLLPQLLRHVLDGGLVDDTAHPMHLPPRFAIGGSDVLQRPHVDWSWMPSMTESLTRRRAPQLEPDALDPIPPV